MKKCLSKEYKLAKVKLVLAQIVLLLFILFVWEIGARIGLLDEFFSANPHQSQLCFGSILEPMKSLSMF